MKTNTGQVTVRANEVALITKALRPLPEKFHGLQDVEEIYRRRYVDLIMNEDSKKAFITRSKAVSAIRTILNSKGYYENSEGKWCPICFKMKVHISGSCASCSECGWSSCGI